MRRDGPLIAAVLILCVVLLAIAMVLWNMNVERAGEIESLRAQLADAQSDEPQEGGAETDLPPARPVAVESGGEWTFPIASRDYSRPTSPIGDRRSPFTGEWVYHQGTDLVGAWRAEIVAAGPGRVLARDELLELADGTTIQGGHWPPPDDRYSGHPIYGGLVIIRHDNGWTTLYAHLHETRVAGGQRVAAGQPIGRQGNTGKSVRDHLHFELITPEGERVNALKYIEPRSAE